MVTLLIDFVRDSEYLWLIWECADCQEKFVTMELVNEEMKKEILSKPIEDRCIRSKD